MKIIFVVGGLYTESSGIARIMSDLANTFEDLGIEIPVYTARRAGASTASHMLDHPERCVSRPALWMGRLSWSPSLKTEINKAVQNADIVHNHSLWMLPNAYASAAARKHGKPVVFTSYGYLEPWAFSHSGWKKRLAGKWFQDRDLHDAACIHVATQHELRGVRDYGLKNPVAVIPNGIDHDKYINLPDASVFLNKFGLGSGRKRILFLSRLHVKKGVLNLLEAWSRLGKDADGWELVLCGPDDGFESDFRDYVNKHMEGSQVVFTGPVTGDLKLSAYASADAFILPSYSEGFSNAVLEAMISGLPVLLTPECNFPEAVESGGAINTSQDASSVEEALRTVMNMSEAERSAMGDKGRELIKSRYTWEKIAPEILKLYSWVGGKCDKPDFISEA